MIIGAHVIVQSTNAEADRAFFRDVLKLTHVDDGAGWLIFGLPPSEVAVHPAKKNSVHELYLMCEDVNAFVKAMKQKKLACAAPQDQGWGVVTSVTLPGGGKLGVYQPRHARPGVGGGKTKGKGSMAEKGGGAGKGASKMAAPKKGAPTKGADTRAAAKKSTARKR